MATRQAHFLRFPTSNFGLTAFDGCPFLTNIILFFFWINNTISINMWPALTVTFIFKISTKCRKHFFFLFNSLEATEFFFIFIAKIYFLASHKVLAVSMLAKNMLLHMTTTNNVFPLSFLPNLRWTFSQTAHAMSKEKLFSCETVSGTHDCVQLIKIEQTNNFYEKNSIEKMSKLSWLVEKWSINKLQCNELYAHKNWFIPLWNCFFFSGIHNKSFNWHKIYSGCAVEFLFYKNSIEK